MDFFVNFFVNNWNTIILVILMLVEILILILKKNKVVNSPWAGILSHLPQFIKDAETLGLSGPEKLKHVVYRCVEYLTLQLGLSDSEVLHRYGKDIIVAVESILSTPQKKEVKK